MIFSTSMSSEVSSGSRGLRTAFRWLTGIRDYVLLWGLLAGGLWLARPRAGASPDEYWLFTIWTVSLLSLCSHMLRARRDISTDQPAP